LHWLGQISIHPGGQAAALVSLHGLGIEGSYS
jgi:hypothetical protein